MVLFVLKNKLAIIFLSYVPLNCNWLLTVSQQVSEGLSIKRESSPGHIPYK